MEYINTSIESDGALLITFSSEVTNKSDISLMRTEIASISKEVKKIYAKQGKNIKILIDITGFKAIYLTETVNALVEVAKEDKDLVERTAIFGGSLQVKIIADIIIELSGRKNMKIFKTKPEAVQWLNS